MKKIKEGEEFQLGTTVFTYSISEGAIKLHVIRSYAPAKQFTPPTLEEVKAYFKEKGYMEIAAIKAHEYYTAGDWKDSKGSQVKNWKQKMLGVWMRDEFKVEEPQQPKMVR